MEIEIDDDKEFETKVLKLLMFGVSVCVRARWVVYCSLHFISFATPSKLLWRAAPYLIIQGKNGFDFILRKSV